MITGLNLHYMNANPDDKKGRQSARLLGETKKNKNINFFLKYLGVLPEFAVSTNMLQKP